MRGLKSVLLWVVRHWLVFVICAVSVFLGRLVAYSDRFRSFEFENEQRIQMEFAPASLSNKIAVVEITPSDAAETVPRSQLGLFIERMKKVGAEVLVIDLQFKDDAPKAENQALVASLRNSPPMKVAIVLNNSEQSDERARNGARYQFSLPEFMTGEFPDTIDGGQSFGIPTGLYSGSISLLAKDEADSQEVENIALIAFREYYGIEEGDVKPDWKNGVLRVGINRFQMGPDGDFLIDWPRENQNFKPITFREAMSMLSAGDPKSVFRKKVVILGNLTGDQKAGTVNGSLPGVIVVADTLNTMFRSDQGKPVRLKADVNTAWSAILALIIGLGLTSHRLSTNICASVFSFAFSVLAPIGAVKLAFPMPEATISLATCLITCAVGLTLRAALPSQFPVIWDEPFEATVLVVDLKNSTEMVGRHGGRRGGLLLSRFVSLGRRSVQLEGGRIVRPTGDGLVAVFRAREVPHHAEAAIKAVERIKAGSAALQNPDGAVSFRAGFESGTLHGTARSSQGLPFHVAARLEALPREEDVLAVIGPVAAGLIGEEYEKKVLGEYDLKGINEKVIVYAVLRR